MRRVGKRFLDFFSRLADRRTRRSGARARPPVRLELWRLEERVVPSTNGLGTVSGQVAVASTVGASPFSLQGIQVMLTGTSNRGDAVNLTATTDAQGDFALRSVEPGVYELTASPGATLIQGASIADVSVLAGQNTVLNLSVGGLAGAVISLRDFLSSATQATFGLPAAGPTANRAPTVRTPIANVALSSGGGTKQIDLAANFSDPDTTDSQVVFDTSDGPMTMNLFDSQAPQTVANFLDYVENSRYNDTIFHRLDTNPPVLQGGGFGVQAAAGGGVTFPAVANSNDPQLANEFNANLPDALGTLAMAKLGGNPNSATSEFFFNLADNSSTLGASNNGGFAVLGDVASDPTSQAVFQQLQSTQVQNESAFNSAFGTLPINSSANLTHFPTNTQPSDYLTINDVRVVKQDESLTYTVTANSNPSLVSAQFVPGHPEVLSVQGLGQTGGTATITVQATDQFGASVQTSFQVTVVPLTVSSVTNPVDQANVTNTTVSGTATAGASISVTATDGANTTQPVTVTAGANGAWTASGVNVQTLADGTITYTATTTDAAGDTVTATKTATKNASAPALAITTVTNPINASNDKNTTASGTTVAGDTVKVTATDGTTTTTPVTATVDSSGHWTATGIDVSSLKDGTITYTATVTNPSNGNTGTATTTATKDTVPPTVAITTVTNPITAANQTSTSASGTSEAGDSVSVTATDGKTTTAPVQAAVGSDGAWTATGIDVSGLQNGTITYTATATDSAGNTNTSSLNSTKGP